MAANRFAGAGMVDVEFVLSRDQRDAIMRAVAAIRRQTKELGGKPNIVGLWVIETNLSIIHANLTNLPSAHSSD